MEYIALYTNSEGNKRLHTSGCGCCSGDDPANETNLLQAIEETKEFLKELEDEYERIKGRAQLC